MAVSPHLLAQLRTWNLDGASLNDAFNCFPNKSPQHVRSAVCIFFTGYFQPLEQWLRGNRFVRISIDGNEFDARFYEAVDTIYRSSQQQPVAFSHGAAIAMWTMMNVANPPLDLAQSQPLPNTGYVVVRGNPQDGWTLLDWNATKLN